MENSIINVAKERLEQIDKHGNTISIDNDFNFDEQLKSAAIYALTLEPEYYPESWDTWFSGKIIKKSEQERITIAAALLLAESDRLIASKMNSEEIKEYEQHLKEMLKDVIQDGENR